MRKKLQDERIYTAALKCFSTHGFKKTTLDEIAGELNMTGASIYAYASGKRELYEATVAFALCRWQDKVRSEVALASSANEKLKALANTALAYLATDAEFCGLIKNDPSIFPMFPYSDVYYDINADSVAMIREILLGGIASGEFRELDVDSVSEVIFSLYKSFVIRAYVNGESDYLNEHLAQAIDLMLHGLIK